MSSSHKAQLLASKLADGNTNKLSDNDINDLRSMLSKMSLHSPRNSNPIREPKVNDPRTFSGVNDHLGENRLENFITQVNMVLHLQSSRFPDELSKVFFAASYMTDIAFEWIQPYIAAVGTKDEDPLVSNYDLFCDSLRKMFGDVTHVSDAENKVMTMKQADKTAAEYTTEFKRYAVLTEFNEPALFWAYRNNINTQLQDELIIRDTPSTLQEYQDLVINLDSLFRERKGNKNSRNKFVPTKSSYKQHPSTQPQLPNSPPPDHDPLPVTQEDNGDIRPMEIDAATKSSKGYTPLTFAEKQRRKELGLCAYCGGNGHYLKVCPVIPTRSINAVYSTAKFQGQGNTKIFVGNQDSTIDH